MEFIIKNKSKLEIIDEVIKAFEACYPDYLDYCKQELTKLRQVSRAGFTDAKGRYTYCSMKVPTVLYMFLQQVIPDFGQDSDDIALLTNRIKDLDAHIPLHKERQSLLVPKQFASKFHNLMSEKDAANARKKAIEEDARFESEGPGRRGEDPAA